MRQLIRSKKAFNIGDVPTLAIMLVTIAIVLGVGMTVLSQVLETQHCDGYWNATASMCYVSAADQVNESRSIGFNATYGGVEGLEDFSDWQTTWAVIIAAAVVIGIIATSMFFRRKEG